MSIRTTRDGKTDGLNQPQPLTGSNAYRGDPLLLDLTSGLDRLSREALDTLGRSVRSGEAQELARMADLSQPVLRSHDARGERIDQIDFHPAWHALLRRSMAIGLHCSIWDSQSEPEARGGVHRLRTARMFLTAQLETAHLSALTTTHASVTALAASPAVQREWAPRILSRKYDSTPRPASQKSGVLIGLGVSERQAGSDMRALTSSATRAGEGIYRLTGHKAYLSNPMADAFLMLAESREGLSCFLVPRLLDDGERNGMVLQRLKQKLGQRAGAAAEVDCDGALGWLLGEAGDGQRTVSEVITLTRLDATAISAGLMRAGLSEAVHFARGRQAFGKTLERHPLMSRVLADLALDCAAATALAMRLAEAFDRASVDQRQAAYARIMTPAARYWAAKIAPAFLAECLEVLGGAGYSEDRPLARYYRDAPAAILWESPGNIMALDLARLLPRGRELFEQVFADIGRDIGSSGAKTVAVLRASLQLCERDEGSARIFTEQLALAAAAAELYRLGAGKIADAFLETRLAGGWRSTYGMIDGRFDAPFIVDLLYPPAA